MPYKYSMFLAFCVLLLFSCIDKSDGLKYEKDEIPMERLPDNKAGEIVQKAIERAGGWEAWSKKKTFSFDKRIEYLDSIGNIERTLVQHHQYQLQPVLKFRMTWEEDGEEYVIINNGNQAKKYKNGKEMTDEDSKNSAWNSSFGSNYMISMPFKLTDEGTILNYETTDKLPNGKEAYVLKVEYEKGAGSAGGMHTWWYYFDKNNYDLIANHLETSNGNGMTLYDPIVTVDGIRIHKKRLSHRSNPEKELVLLRTIYTNENMKFDEPLNEKIFDLN